MKSIIEQIYFCRRGHSESIEPSDEYRLQLDKVVELSDELSKTLNDNQQKLLRNYSFETAGLESASNLTHYIEGFKVGLLIGIECLENNKNPPM